MEPHAFIAEVYRRMSVRHQAERLHPGWQETQRHTTVVRATAEYAPYLPPEKNAAMLDIGFGTGWFLGACLKLGYRNLAGADFGIPNKSHVRGWAPECISLHEIQGNIGDFLSDRKEQYDFIHDVARDRAHTEVFALVGDRCFVLGLETGRVSTSAHSEHGRSLCELEPVCDVVP